MLPKLHHFFERPATFFLCFPLPCVMIPNTRLLADIFMLVLSTTSCLKAVLGSSAKPAEISVTKDSKWTVPLYFSIWNPGALHLLSLVCNIAQIVSKA